MLDARVVSLSSGTAATRRPLLVRLECKVCKVGFITAKPETFLEVLVHDLESAPSLTALCVCYELGEWRTTAFSKHLFEWLPEFALNWHERQRFNDATGVALLRRAAHVVYESQKYQSRGEFGELMLHAILRDVFDSEVAISKIYFKDATNNTVKGFDAVHVVQAEEGLELWLGEVKLYAEVTGAIRDVVAELHEHFKSDYLKSEFVLILNKLDENWPHAEAMREMLSPNTSLDKVFKRITVPVLLTYNSQTLIDFNEHSDSYVSEFEREVRDNWARFATKELPPNIRIRLILLPLQDKAKLVTELDRMLKAWQNI